MSRRSRLHYTLTTIGYGASRMKARLPRSTCLLGDSLSFGAAVRYKLPSHTTSRQNQTPQPQSLGSVRAIAFRSWLPPIGPIKDSHLQSLRHARRNFRLRLRLSLQNTAALPTPILSLNLVQRLGGSHVEAITLENAMAYAGVRIQAPVFKHPTNQPHLRDEIKEASRVLPIQDGLYYL